MKIITFKTKEQVKNKERSDNHISAAQVHQVMLKDDEKGVEMLIHIIQRI